MNLVMVSSHAHPHSLTHTLKHTTHNTHTHTVTTHTGVFVDEMSGTLCIAAHTHSSHKPNVSFTLPQELFIFHFSTVYTFVYIYV